MTPEIVERVARAIMNAAAWSSFWDEDDAKVLARAAIRATLDALAEPSEGMMQAAVSADDQTPRGEWRSMHAALRKEWGL